jgi:hypothetical protein
MPRKRKSPPICVLCKLPIKPGDRPSIRLDKGREAHMECYVKALDANKDSVQ